MDETIMTIRYGMSSPVSGEIRIIPRAWLYGKGTVREFRRIIKLCVESDYFFGTETLRAWNEVLTEELRLVRTQMHNRTQEFNSHECDWTWTAEHKREFDRDMKECSRKEKKFQKLLTILQEMIK